VLIKRKLGLAAGRWSNPAVRVLIVGCGYIGLPLGAELVRLGHDVCGVTRSDRNHAALQAASIQPFIADVAQRTDFDKLPPPFDWVVNTVSSSKGGVEEYKQVYLQGTRHLIDWLSTAPPKKFVYTSSTSVYGQTDGSQVKESSPAEPAGETSQVLATTEKLLLDAAHGKKLPAVILRVAGIYGPERGHLFLQYLKDEARIPGRGERLLNMIHRADVVGCIIAALKNGQAGEVYNAVDDEPVPQIHFFRWLSETLGKNMPPFGDEPAPAGRKRAVTHKKVLNRKLKAELGYQFKYPTFRQGYSAEIKRMQDAGLI
jgi:nucleoside-diphosphate-sugar epimerase